MKNNIEALGFIDELLRHAYRKGALCDTPGGPMDMATMVNAVGILKKTAEWADGINEQISKNRETEALRQRLMAELAPPAPQQQAPAKQPCVNCDEKKDPVDEQIAAKVQEIKSEHGRQFTVLHEEANKPSTAAPAPAGKPEVDQKAPEAKPGETKPDEGKGKKG